MVQPAPLTPLGIAALALLTERPMHPYEMYQLLMARGEDRLLKVRPGTLYHAVGRLADRQLVLAAGTGRKGNRPERTTYEITSAGRATLAERVRDLLEGPANEFPSFPLAISQAHNLPAETVAGLIESRIQAQEQHLAALDAGERDVTARNLEPKYWLDITYQQTMLRAEIGWLRGLQQDMSTGSLRW